MGAEPPIDFVEAEELACVRGGRPVFRDVGFRVERGRALLVEGANGSGKTSLLRLIAGLLAPAKGTIAFSAGGAAVSDGEERGSFVGWLGHHDAAKPQLTPRELLRFYQRLYTTSSTLPQGEGESVESILDEVGLSRAAALPCQYLSAGQKRRLALGRLKLCGRPLWLLDEPLASLDAAGKSLLLEFLREHLAAGGLALIATHDPLGIEATRLQLA